MQESNDFLFQLLMNSIGNQNLDQAHPQEVLENMFKAL